ncbi:MAG: antitoxin YezG family protein [Lentisphaeraceae bacterium]|nr:antitoxin YezG family protein [Lentisphaeraceae bacterium]
MNQEIIKSQNEVILALIETVDNKWKQIVCSYELQEDDKSFNDDSICFYIKKSLFKTSIIDIEINNRVREAFKSLRQAIKMHKGKEWNSCEIIIENSGDFEFDFSYERPKRINGILDDKSYEKYNNWIYTPVKKMDS